MTFMELRKVNLTIVILVYSKDVVSFRKIFSTKKIAYKNNR